VRGAPYDFSFSGLKTALRSCLEGSPRHLPPGRSPRSGPLSKQELADLAASFQEAVVDVLVSRTLAAATDLRLSRIVISGGVSANSRLRARMEEEGRRAGIEVYVPSIRFCTDNAAMIAFAGCKRLERGEVSGLDLDAVAALPL
jgi:N6-L-threonylcarbamoyladenine synthase